MREAPAITDQQLRDAIQEYYGLNIAALRFLPIGNDAASFVYDVATDDGRRLFFKLRAAHGFAESSVLIPHTLHAQGVPHLLTPIPTAHQGVWAPINAFVGILYPWLEAQQAAEVDLTHEEWRDLGTALRQIHAGRLPPAIYAQLPQETFRPSRREILTRLETLFTNEMPDDPLHREFRAVWEQQQSAIRFLLHRTDTLGTRLRDAGLPFVLCHGDLHPWNVLRDDRRQIWIVDWDETVLAPKERDLMFVIGGIGHPAINPQTTVWVMQGYGETEVNNTALAYYRAAWAVQDIAAYAEEIFFTPDRSVQARADAVRATDALFAPGNTVEIALNTTAD